MVQAKRKDPIPYKTRRGTVSIPARLRALSKVELHAVLATDAKRQPYASLITYVFLPDLKGAVFATPKATFKYKSILENNRVALLIDTRTNNDKDFLETEVVTILGHARPIRRGNTWTELANLLMKKHPRLSGFITSPSTALVLIEFTRCFHVSQFQTVSRWEVR